MFSVAENLNPVPCHPRYYHWPTCINHPDGYSCTCGPGFYWNTNICVGQSFFLSFFHSFICASFCDARLIRSSLSRCLASCRQARRSFIHSPFQLVGRANFCPLPLAAVVQWSPHLIPNPFASCMIPSNCAGILAFCR